MASWKERLLADVPRIVESIPTDSDDWAVINDTLTDIADMQRQGKKVDARKMFHDMMGQMEGRYINEAPVRGKMQQAEDEMMRSGGRLMADGDRDGYGSFMDGADGMDAMDPGKAAGAGGPDVTPDKVNALGIPVLDQLRQMNGPKPKGMQYAHDRKRGVIRRMDRGA